MSSPNFLLRLYYYDGNVRTYYSRDSKLDNIGDNLLQEEKIGFKRLMKLACETHAGKHKLGFIAINSPIKKEGKIIKAWKEGEELSPTQINEMEKEINIRREEYYKAVGVGSESFGRDIIKMKAGK